MTFKIWICFLLAAMLNQIASALLIAGIWFLDKSDKFIRLANQYMDEKYGSK